MELGIPPILSGNRRHAHTESTRAECRGSTREDASSIVVEHSLKGNGFTIRRGAPRKTNRGGENYSLTVSRGN